MKKILVIDDEPMILSIIETYLGKKYDIKCFECSKELISHLKSEGADLIISDFYMPEISGEQLCEKVREISNCPMILISGSVIESCKKEEFNAFLKKPFGPKELNKLVEEKMEKVA